MDNLQAISCPSCHNSIPAGTNFCPFCGVKLKDAALSTSIGKQALIYFVSFFLAPFGLSYAFKYMKQADEKTRNIGLASLVLTILGISMVIWIGWSFTNSYYGALNQLTNPNYGVGGQNNLNNLGF